MNKKEARRGGSLSVNVIKVMSLFSSLQVVNMLCSVVKQKLVAVWLLSSGMGLFGIFQSVIDTISTLTDVGLRQSSVREVSVRRNDRGALARIIGVIRSWNILAGIIGASAVACLSPFLSDWFFGVGDRWWMFALLGITLLINSLVSGENAILQGLDRFKYIARISLYTSVGGLAISIPLFYWLGASGVVLSFVAYSVCALVAMLIYRYKSEEAEKPSMKMIGEGKGFAVLGLYMSLAAFAGSFAQMFFVAWLTRRSGTSEVGYYQAGHTMVVRYIGFVISAVGMEFYPRLSANIRSRIRHRLFVSHEITLLLLVLTPLILLFELFRPLLVDILYTEEFAVILPFITVGIIHSIFRAVSSCVAYSIVASGDGKTYLFTETLDAWFGAGVCIVMYMWLGLTGIALAYIIWLGSYFLLVLTVSRIRYSLRLSGNAWASIACSVGVSAAAAAAVWYLPAVAYIPLLLIAIGAYGFLLYKFLRRRKRKPAIR